MSGSVISPERRIELNPFDVDAWNLLLRESQTRSIDQARPFYEKLITQFPNAGRYWKAYIEHELRGKNFENVENLFTRCLIKCLNIDLWKCYVFYVRETKGHLASFREKMAQAYDFALDKVGLDMHAYTIFYDYVSFLKAVPAVGQYAENQRISAVRKVYQRGIVTPMLNIEQLWAEYCQFEKSVNATLAEKLLSERNKDYQMAKKVSRALEQVVRGINRQAVSVPARGTAVELKQIDLWKKYIQWEKTNPTQTDDYAHFAKRVIYAYEQALLVLGYHPDIWYESSLFQQEAAHTLTDKGDVKLASVFVEEIAGLFERAIGTLLHDSQLLYFAYADFEEERMKYEKVKTIYDRLLAIESADPTLAYIQLMKFMRRTESVTAARAVFARARKDDRCRFHVYVAAALMEYYCSKDATVAMKIFDFGLKKFGDEPEYALAYVEFLSHLNQDNNTRVIFERILTAGVLPVERSLEIWDRYLEFESQVGDLASILKVDKRRRDALREQFGEMQTLLLIDRYKCGNLVPCTAEQLRTMGYAPRTIGIRSGSMVGGTIGGTASLPGISGSTGGGGGLANGSATTSSSAAQRSQAPNAPSAIMGGMMSLEIGGFPRPDCEQMIPFKPKVLTTGSYHPVPGGVFPPPPAAAALMQLLPPPWTFRGPFVSVDLLMDYIAKYQMNPPTVNQNDKPEPGTMFGTQRVEDVKKEFYQLLATTPDPATLMVSSEYQTAQQQQASAAAQARKRRAAGDSDSDEEGRSNILPGSALLGPGSRDIYRMRMNKKTS